MEKRVVQGETSACSSPRISSKSAIHQRAAGKERERENLAQLNSHIRQNRGNAETAWRAQQETTRNLGLATVTVPGPTEVTKVLGRKER